MSIIMGSATSAVTAGVAAQTDSFAPAVRELLDHIAVELAEEYVRLMEAAVDADATDSTVTRGNDS